MGLSLSYLSCQYFGFYWKGQPPSPLFPSLWWAPRDWLSSTFTLPCFAVWWCWVTFCGTATQACDSAKEVTASTRKVRLVLSGVSNWIQLTHLYWPFFFFFSEVWENLVANSYRSCTSLAFSDLAPNVKFLHQGTGMQDPKTCKYVMQAWKNRMPFQSPLQTVGQWLLDNHYWSFRKISWYRQKHTWQNIDLSGLFQSGKVADN